MEALLYRYLAEKKYKNHTPHTIRNVKYALRKYVERPIEEWRSLYYKFSANRAAISSDRELGRLKTFCNWAIKNGYLHYNPFKEVDSPKVEKRLPKTLTRKQAHELLMATGRFDLKMKAIFSTFLYTGLRKSELLHLQPHHVDTDRSAIFVNQGKGCKDRLIPMNFNIRRLLIDWKKKRPPHYYFFCSSDVTLRRMKKELQSAVKFNFTIHQLRHTAASHMLESGIDLFTLQKILGHANIKTTCIYLGTSVKHMQEQINKLDFRF